MNPKDNMVKKNKKEEIEEEEELLEYDIDNEDVPTKSEAKGKMVKFMGIILGIVILLLLIMFLITTLSPRKYTYTQIENILENAAVSYFKDFPDSLPKEEGSIVEIDSSNLVQAEKMKELVEYTGENVTCSGKVQVEKSGNDYLYTPYLNCGNDYATTELYKKVTSEENIVTAGYGLYNNNGTYTFRGEEVNNYVKMGLGLWRIVKITSNNNIVLISNEGTAYGHSWDDRYNERKSYEAGINQYSVSRIKDYLNKIYTNPSKKEEDGEYILSKKDRSKLVYFNLCTGKRSVNSESKDNSQECTEVLKNQKIGLLTVSEYMYASLDPNCKTPGSRTCKNYNYLSATKGWWLLTADKDDNAQVFQIDQGGRITSELAGTYAGVRPVVHLNSKVLYKSGKGTLEKPYRIK